MAASFATVGNALTNYLNKLDNITNICFENRIKDVNKKLKDFHKYSLIEQQLILEQKWKIDQDIQKYTEKGTFLDILQGRRSSTEKSREHWSPLDSSVSAVTKKNRSSYMKSIKEVQQMGTELANNGLVLVNERLVRRVVDRALDEIWP